MITLVMTSRAENIELALGHKKKDSIDGTNPENVDVNNNSDGVNSENVGVNTAIHHSRKERCSYIIRRMKDNPVITSNDLSTILSASKRTIERDIAWLTGKQIITRTGADKNGRWIVLKEFGKDE